VTLNPREFFTAFATAMNARDYSTLEGMVHPDFVTFMPQSGEQSRGLEGFRLQGDAYPGGAPDVPPLPEVRLFGDDERWAITPAFTVVPLASPSDYTIVGRVTYPDGNVWHSVLMVELRDERLYRMEVYFAPELPAPLAESIATFPRG
jgi:hypothetical protein